MKLQLIVMGLLSFLASICILYAIGSLFSIDWLQFDDQQPLFSPGFWLPLSIALLIGYLIVRKTRLG
ncbi:hypothetical protein [Ectobacillus sp. sgz5001026]|uniref:hypothetical protein n=1 Tax=Ectobacillus sp. sgz5001026 TaxID=3242473 RepID=UPI0036D42655